MSKDLGEVIANLKPGEAYSYEDMYQSSEFQKLSEEELSTYLNDDTNCETICFKCQFARE